MSDLLHTQPGGPHNMRRIWQLAHHLVAHPLIGLSFGRLWAWRFHDWTLPHAWPGKETSEQPARWAGLE